MPDLNNVGIQKLSEETAEKGAAFVNALIQDGHTDKSMKAAFGLCVLRAWLRRTQGRVDKAATKMGIDRTIVFSRIRKFGLREELEAIRAGEEQ